MMKELNVLITLQSKFVSVNALYNARVIYKGGKPIAAIYKNPEANRVESEVRCQLLAVDFSEYLEWLRTTKQFELHLRFILKKNASHKDSSNLIKNLEDIWTRFVVNDLGITEYDDSMHIKVTAEKSIIPGASSEYAILTLRESRANIRYDIDPKPEKVWISGWTGEEITAFLPPLPKRPKKKEKYLVSAEHEEADTKVYILKPEEFKPYPSYMIAEIYGDIVESLYLGYGFIFIGYQEDGWTKEEKEGIDWLKGKVDEIKEGRIKMEPIKAKEDILGWM